MYQKFIYKITDMTTNERALKDKALKDKALKDRALKDRALKDRALKDMISNKCFFSYLPCLPQYKFSNLPQKKT